MVNMSENRKNHSAQRMNIEAVKRIAETVKTTLGPLGMDKMMVDGGGNVIVTNDGATILRELDSAHPAAKMVVEVSKMQESNAYDGTTSTVVLASQLLSNSETLFEKGLHPNVINKGYTAACNMAVEYLNGMKDASQTDILDGLFADNSYEAIAKTAITGKSLEASEDAVAALCVETIEAVGHARDVKTLAAPGGSLVDSYLYRGVALNKDFIGGGDSFDNWSSEDGVSILLLNGGLTEDADKGNMTVQVDAQSYSQVKNAGREKMLDAAKHVVSSGANVVLMRDGAHDTAVSYLRKQGISIVHRIPQSTMDRLAKELDTPIFSTPDATCITGHGFISKETYNDVDYLFIHATNTEATLVLFGATQSTLDEVQRGFDDALGVVSLVKNGDSIQFGGGSTYLAIAMHLREQASTVGGRAQMAIESFADALEIIPATIAENAGFDALDTVLEMRHKRPEFYGPDVDNGGTKLMNGVYEPTSLIRSALTGATEVANAILRIDDVIGRRGEG